MNVRQILALNQLGGAFIQLSEAWDDELGEALSELGVLPQRDLTEAYHAIFHLIEGVKKKKIIGITVNTHNTSNTYTRFTLASAHIQELAKIFGYDHCQVQLQWEDQTTHEVEYDLCRDPFDYDLSKRVIFYLEQAAKGDSPMFDTEHVEAVKEILAEYQLEDKVKYL